MTASSARSDEVAVTVGIANTPESGTAGVGDCAVIVIGIDPPKTCMSGAVGVSGVFTTHEPGGAPVCRLPEVGVACGRWPTAPLQTVDGTCLGPR